MKKTLVILLTGIMLLTGCGSSSTASSERYAASDAGAGSYKSGATNGIYTESTMDYDAEPAAAEEYYDEYEGEMYDGGESGPSTPKTQATNRKLIRNIGMTVETKEFDELIDKVTRRTAFYGGYIENSNVYNGSSYTGRKTRSSSMTLRIPADKMDEFLSEVAEVSNVVSRDENVSDVTLTYVDMQSHKNALKAEEQRLIEMMDKAETIEDLITIESRLSDIRYQVESMESQLRSYDNQVDYATLRLSVTEVEELTPVEEKSALETMKDGFSRSLKNVIDDIKDFFMNLVIDLPYLIKGLVILAIIFLIVRLIAHKIFGKHIFKRMRAFAKAKWEKIFGKKNVSEETAAEITEEKAEKKEKTVEKKEK